MARHSNTEPIQIGLEIGTTKVRAVAVKFNADRSLNILGAEETASVGVSNGEIRPDTVAMANARDCVTEVLRSIEDSAHIHVRKLLLAVDGAHFVGKNQQAVIQLNPQSPQVQQQHLDEIRKRAQLLTSFPQLECLHELFQRYRLDDQDVPISPLGLSGRNLEAKYHIIAGDSQRIKRTMSCVLDIGYELDDIVFSPIAAAQCLFTESQSSLEYRRRGSLLIDIGGGSTKYALYFNDDIIASGSIPVGGNLATRDVQLAFDLPQSTAEYLKINEGNVAPPLDGVIEDPIHTPVNEHGFAQPSINRVFLNHVLRERFSEIFRLVKKQLPHDVKFILGAGVFLCGGSSLMRGINELCQEVFECHIYMVRDSEAMMLDGRGDDVRMLHQTPQFVTPMGLIRYAELARVERMKPQPEGFWSRLWSWMGRA